MNKIWTEKDVIIISTIDAVLFGILMFLMILIKPKLAYLSLIVDLGLFFIVLGTFMFFLKKKNITWKEFGFGDTPTKWFFISFFLVICTLVVGGFLSTILNRFIGSNSSDISFIKNMAGDSLWLNILNLKVMFVIFVPFAEELFFRGLIFRFIRQEKSFLFSATLSSFLFSLAHFNLGMLPFTLALGFSTAFVLEKSKSMFFPFFVHAGVNSISSNLFIFSFIL